MSVGLNKASVFAVTEESAVGVYELPSTGEQFLPLRPGNEVTYAPEELKSDELVNDIGATKSSTGKEKVSGKHSTYIKHSGIEGQEPQAGILYKSILGAKHEKVEAGTASGSTTSNIVVPIGEGADYVQGQSVLVKKGNGYEIRNIASISGDVLTLNFNLSSAPAAGVSLGAAITYLPVAQGHPTFSTTKYLGNGFAKEVSFGNTVTEASFKLEANKFGEADFSFEGTGYYFNPISVESGHNLLDFEDNTGVKVAEVEGKIYKTPIELADAIQVAMNAVSSVDYLVTFNGQTGLFTIKSVNGTLLNLPFVTGASSGFTFGGSIGFTADLTGSLSYDSDTEQSYAPDITPVYDADNKIIVKGSELFIGNQSDNICFCAQSVNVTISKTVEDVDCICEESGVLEKIPTAREASMEVVAVLKKHDVALLDALLKNEGISAMFNAGPKTGGNWVPGKCFNVYMQKCTVNKYTTSGESFIQVNITLKGYVTSTEKDIYVNFV